MSFRNTILCLLSLAALPFFVACHPREQVISPAAPQPPVNHMDTGTGDGAGGNTCQGRPIESYACDIMGTAAYQKKIAPLLNARQALNDDIYRLLTYSLRTKNWYVLPCPLDKLPAEKISSMTKNIEQAGRQTFKEVWIDQKLFSAMSEDDQAILIMHEMLMGIRLLKFDSSLNQCLAFLPVERCDQANPATKGTPNDLVPSDYDDVRRTTHEIFKIPPGASQADWEDFLAQRNFSFYYKYFRRKADVEDLSPSELSDRLQRVRILKRLPEIGQLRLPTKIREKCQVEFNVDVKAMKLSLTIRRSQGPTFQHDFVLPEKFHSESRPRGQRRLGWGQLSGVETYRDKKLNDKEFSLRLSFDEVNSLAAVEVSEMVCTKESTFDNGRGHGCTMETANDGFMYQCVDSEELLEQF